MIHAVDGAEFVSDANTLSRLAEDAISRGDVPAAESLLLQLVERSPGDVSPLFRLGSLYADQSKLQLALETFKRILAIDPGDSNALCMVGMTHSDLGQFSAAADYLQQAVRARPDAPEFYFNLGLAQFELANFAAASSSFSRCFALRRGEPWGERAAQRLQQAQTPMPAEEMTVNTVKILHDCEQLEYLLQSSRLPVEFRGVLAEYQRLHAELRGGAPSAGATCQLDARRFPLVAQTYKRPLVLSAPSPYGPLLSDTLDVARIEGEYFRSRPNVVVVDDFLSPDALRALREFCRCSTIWNNPQGEYLGGYFYDGFHSEMLLRLAAELRDRLPGIIQRQFLQMIWGYKYARNLNGIAVHADAAAVNVNFWITENEANEDPQRGGLLIYPHDAPPEWGFSKFNSDPDTVARYLESIGSKPIRVPYRENRAVIFDSDLFHATDALHFREGYTNRRVNITFLYGLRRPGDGGGA
jgi:tetratricopeptide (TPR) repeat protein